MPITRKWDKWAQSLWSKAELQWIKREGQDHFYRQQVVIPALVWALQAPKELPLQALVDLGAGDGSATAMLLKALQPHPATQIVLVDRNKAELEAASQNPELAGAKFVQADLSARWAKAVRGANPSIVFVSMFVLQELPYLKTFFGQFQDFQMDRLLAVIVHPSFSELLRQRDVLHDVQRGEYWNDWRFAAGYPIATEQGTIYLPHFQRKLEDIRQLAAQVGLALTMWRELFVPNTEEAQKMFASTVYGREILWWPSALLLEFREQRW